MTLFSSTRSTEKHGLVSSRAELFRVLVLALACALIWVSHTDRWTAESWHLPTDYSGDSLEILARIKAASEGDTVPLGRQVIKRLGAPLGADWNSYPTPEKIQLLILGGIARLGGDIFIAANMGLVGALIANALAFYWVVRRWLRCRWEWSAAGALLFSFTYFTFHRGLAHFSFVFAAGVPLGLLACWLVARSSRLEWRSMAGIACIGAGALLGCHNTYYLYFWLPLMGWAVIAQLLGRRRRANIAIGVAAIAAAVFVFVLMNFEFWFYRQTGDAMPLLERNYGGTERYALKPVEMLIPPAVHRWDALAFFGSRYTRWSEWRGEVFLPYLGLAGIAALVWLLSVSIKKLLTRQPVPGQALVLGWLVAFATIGGITNVLALYLQFHAFRATSRIAIFISALLLVFLVVRLSRLTMRWPWFARLAAAAGLATIGVADQLPRPEPPERQAEIARLVATDRQFGAENEARLSDGAMVFQLPVVGFPEVKPPWRLGDYEHFRPYLNTQTLRFSYGVPKYRARGRWQLDLPANDTRALVTELESLGFSALYLNRKGFEDGAAGMLNELAALGYPQPRASSSGQQVMVELRPSQNPRLPLARTMTFGRGWHIRPGTPRWAYESEAALLFHNPLHSELAVDISFTISAPELRDVQCIHRGKIIASTAAGPDGREFVISGALLAPGVNSMLLRTDAAPKRSPGGSLRTFGATTPRVRTTTQQ